MWQNQQIFSCCNFLHIEFAKLLWVHFDEVAEEGELAWEFCEVGAEGLVESDGLPTERLSMGRGTYTVSRWDLALPDCSPKVLLRVSVMNGNSKGSYTEVINYVHIRISNIKISFCGVLCMQWLATVVSTFCWRSLIWLSVYRVKIYFWRSSLFEWVF
jgi:hypothetical protein